MSKEPKHFSELMVGQKFLPIGCDTDIAFRVKVKEFIEPRSRLTYNVAVDYDQFCSTIFFYYAPASQVVVYD